MNTVRCPACRGDVGVDPADYGHPVSCPLCGDVFTPYGDDTLSDSPAAPPADERSGERRASDEEDPERPSPRQWNDDDEELDRPGRGRRRRRRTKTFDESLKDAEKTVFWPANGLIWTGIVNAVCAVIGGLIYAGFGVVLLNDPNAQQSDGIVVISVGAAIAAIGLPMFLVMMLGGRQLKRLDGGTGLVYAAAVISFVTVFLCGICMPNTWAALTFGIWALVAVNNADVQEVLTVRRGE